MMLPSPQLRYQPGDKIGASFQVHKALMGGMGEVYLCFDLEQFQPYALKTLQKRFLSSTQQVGRVFEDEVATWVALEKHPNIVRCFNMEILDNQPFMVLEWVAGEEDKGNDLRSWLRHGPLELHLALEVALDICRGLVHVQEKQPGLVHRDLKPENILMAEGGLAKITDFGLAQIVNKGGLQPDEALDTTNGRESIFAGKGIAGTPAYMAPEQWQGKKLDVRTDIYALGCILYEMLTGMMPFQVKGLPVTPQTFKMWLSAMQNQHESGPRPSLPGALPSSLNHLLHRCLIKTQKDRLVSPTDLIAQLTGIYQAELGRAPTLRFEIGNFTAGDYSNRGHTYYQLGRHDQALADYNRAIEIEPGYAKSYSNRGNVYRALGQYPQAHADFDRAIALDLTLFAAYMNRGLLYHELGEHAQALADCNQAIILNPSNSQSYNSRGTVHRTFGQYQLALADFDRAIALNINNAQAFNNRGLIYHDLGEHARALVDYDRAIALDPFLPAAYFNRGLTHYSLGQYEQAIVNYDRAIALDSNDAQNYYNRGLVYNSLGQYKQALADCDRAVELNNMDSNGYTNRGLVYHSLGQNEMAIEDFKSAIALVPNISKNYHNLGVVFVKRRQLQSALAAFVMATKLGHLGSAKLVAPLRNLLGMDPDGEIDTT